MDEVVITSMGTKEKKVNLTGAVTNVDISQIQTPASLPICSVAVFPVLSPYSQAANRDLICRSLDSWYQHIWCKFKRTLLY